MSELLGRLILHSRRWRKPGARRPFARPPVHHGDTGGDGHPPRILVVTPFPIHPVIHGGAVRISNLLRRMAGFSEVSLLVLGGATDDEAHRAAYADCCKRVFFHRLDNGEAVDDPHRLLPPAAARFCSPAVTDRISALVDAHRIDVVQLEFAELGAHVVRSDGARTVLVEHDLGFTTQARQRALGMADRFDSAEFGGDPLDGLRQERFEIRACSAADQVHCMSSRDRDTLASKLGDAAHVEVIPNGVDTEAYRQAPAAGRRRVLFLGSFPHLPNLDAFEYLVETVWPEIRRRKPDAELTVAGARPPEQVLEQHGRNGIRVVGEVEEAAPLYREHRVLAVPLRAGSGTRLKILEAMASGLPVVSTTIGAEGLDLSDPPEIAIADEPAVFAEAVAARLDADDDEIEISGDRSRTLVKARFDWSHIGRDLGRALARLHTGEPTPHRLTITGADQPGDSTPDVSLVIAADAGSGPGSALLDGIAAQKLDGEVEVLVVDRDGPESERRQWRAANCRVISVRSGEPNLGAALNAGARQARGRILVFTSPHAIPADEHWLAGMTAPFAQANPPAAVQGGITWQLGDGAPPFDPWFTRESARWRSDHDGTRLTLVNTAMARKTWQSFPIPPFNLLAGLAWQRIASDHEMLILPCLAAAVRVVVTPNAAVQMRSAFEEGRILRRSGLSYTTADLFHDLRRPRPGFDSEGNPTPAATRHQRVLGLVRPLGLWLGSR